MKALLIVLGLIPSAIAVVLCALSAQGSTASTNQTSAITFQDFDALFSSEKTDSQKDRAFNDLKGKRVIWEGVVSNVREDTLYVREKLSTMTYDVIVKMDSNMGMSSLNKGMKVKYAGDIQNYGGLIGSHELNNGQVLSSSAMTEVEQAQFLHDSELAGK